MNVLVALFSLASLIWLVPVIQRGRLLAIGMLTLAVGTVLGPNFFAIQGPILLSLDRILWIGMFAISLAAWRFGHLRIPSLTRADCVVMGIVGWFLISALRGGPDLPKGSPEARWLFYVAMPAGMYLFARLVPIRSGDIQLLTIGLIGLGLYLAVMALFEVWGLHAMVFPHYIVDSESWQFFGRGRGPLMNPAGNGFLISISLTACLLGLIRSGRRAKLLYGIALVILLGGLYATLTRSTWLGGLGGLAIVGLVYSPRWIRVLGLATVVLVAGASVLGVKDQLVRLKRDKNLTAADAEKSVKLRPLLAVVAWEMFKDRPLAGHGFGRYTQKKDRFHTNRSYDLPLEQARDYVQHNVFLSILVDTGLIGLGLMVSWMITIVGIGWMIARNVHAGHETRSVGLLLLGTMTAYVCNGMFHDLTIIPMAHMFLFFIAGITISVYQYGIAAGEQTLSQRAVVSRRALVTASAQSHPAL